MEIGGYTVTGELGRGGMGVVYEALDPRTQRRVALKTVAFQQGSVGARGLERLQREAQALTRLSHPGLVPCYGSGVGPGGFYLAMALVEGTSLEDLLARSGPLPLGRALQVMADVGEALAYVHAQGLLHRDVKPANVLLSTSGRVVLSDFGLVKLSPELHAVSQASLTRSGTMLGTPGYWPPEQAFGKHAQVGPASDVYGWAATLYAALAGRPPREGKSLVELFAAFERPVASLRAARPEVPLWLERLLQRCLAHDPDERPALGVALGELRSFGGEAAAPSGRGRALALGAAAAALLAVAGGFAWVALDLGSGRGPEVAEAGGGASPAVEGAEGEAAEGEASTPLSAGGLRGAGWTAFTGYAAAHDWEGAYRYAMAWRAREPEARLALSAVLQACVGLERYAEAEPYAARLVEVSPDDPGAWTFYARVLLGLDRQDAALEAAARAYGLGERSTEGLWLYASCLNAARRYAVAVEVMGLLLAQEPSAWAYASRAKALSELGRVAEAKRDLAAAAALDPDNPQALFTRGGIKLRALDDPSGVDDLERMLELGHGDALGVLGVVGPFLLERRHEPARLLAFLERWLPGARDVASLCWRIGALLELERGPEALAAAEVLLQRESPALHVLLHARALALVGRVDEALERFAMVYTQIDPRAPEGHYCLDAAERAARLALASPQGPGRLDAALRALERWLEAEPADLEALGMRIAAWMQARRYDLAVTEAERVAPLFARSDDRALRGQFAFTWGDALWRVGRVPEGLTQLTRSLELTPTGLSLLQRGIVLAQLRLDALAEVDLRCALDREPRSARIWYFYMRLCQQAGRPQHARFAGERVLELAGPGDAPAWVQGARELVADTPR